MKHARRAILPAAMILLIAGAAAAQDFNKYHNYAELTAMLQGLAKANPQLVKIESIGKTLEKRDLWMLQIANPAGVPVAERSALLIAANFEADHLIGSELAAFIADYLVKNYPSNAAVKQRLDNTVIYILPRVNPDGAELMWAPVKAARRTNVRPIDDDNDGRIDEDGPIDLNQDGVITVMRVKDPNGTYIIDPDEPRLMKKADPKKGERGEYALYWEGRDQDKDGFIAEDGPGGVNINRNFMHEYAYFKPEAGRYMVSEPETRAVMEWMAAQAHRNVAVILTFGESDNLIVAPTAAGRMSAAKQIDLLEFANASTAGAGKTGMFAGGAMMMRGGRGGEMMMISEDMLREIMAAGGGQFLMGGGGGGGTRGGQTAQPTGRGAQPARAPVTTVNSGDVDYFRTISAKYNELTGIRQQPLVVKPEGAFFQVGYFQWGVPSFSTPGWGLPEAARGGQGGMPGPGGAGGAPPAGAQGGGAQFAAMGGQRGGMRAGAGMGGGADTGDQAQSVDRALLQWMDKEKIDGFVAWKKFQHPDLGEVEIGGFKPYATVNPPAAKIAELGKSHAEFAIYLSSLFPKIGIAKLEAVNHGGGIFRIKAEVENSGFLPTALAHAVVARGSIKPTLVQLQVPPESIISGSPKSNSIQALTGSGGRMKFEWLIKAKPGDSIELKVISQKAGTAKTAVVLK